ncbi:MAG: phosphoribosylaminoimidazolesuccinocarboxamide synthase [Planctomycetes bacterium]|nr:phosphoribosylaminoimidazolesuccinocarboxamide synthase [Planctomycetota bacterium]MCH9726048.1 phosphoribosylaminoimidazolesuccinocarboxamide synthase [Planctomycetota bacterium]MCH9777200.1 phosphoribosylaminoimidazolesuccinocarboxamide synthase [Planctomycetota bacterium]MCH9793473.1 phosphoribosylaminoimidazolesuccinocarboxamide synthase [Planctomycetota bacterium]MDF1742339.1 phosphoribosylaminoimidazolesuccinocarboxamide synthase [Gimesia sp.]
MASSALIESSLSGIPVKRGKVRDVYDFEDRLLFVATDRISAFDWILSPGIPDKGRILTQISRFWFERFKEIPNHLLSMNPADLPLPDQADLDVLQGRCMVVKKTEVVPFECVVRGYLSGSGWKDYLSTQAVCGIELPKGLQQSDPLPRPLFTPATKAETGHDENVSFQTMSDAIGQELAERLRDLSIQIYQQGSDYARERGIILADTKFEFGILDGKPILIDEVLTPDSSRFWPAERYEPGGPQPSLDKQFVRDWLETTTWDKNSPPPELPEEIVSKTREKYFEAFRMLTGMECVW